MRQRIAFEALVLQALWLILRSVCRPRSADHWRGEAISYFDLYGTQGDDAKLHRRTSLFPEDLR